MIIEKAKLIFIHIPKTGGTTFELYLSYFYDVPLDKTTLFSSNNDTINGHSLQHCTYKELKAYLKEQNKDINDYKIISFIRNPFHRILSELLCFHRIEYYDSAEVAHDTIVHMMTDKNPPLVRGYYSNYDNHLISQWSFLTDEKGQLPSNLSLFDMNDIDTIMPSIGFPTFAKARRIHVTHKGRINYDSYLLEKTISFVREVYKDDFEHLFSCTGQAVSSVVDMILNADRLLDSGFVAQIL